MPTIQLETYIDAPIEKCFDLSRSVELHLHSTSKTKEKAIAGKTSGLLNLNETVTWSAVHLGFRQKLTTAITSYNRPFSFTDEQMKGPFKVMKHQHLFSKKDAHVCMIDNFYFEAPFGILGTLVARYYLKNYLHKFLVDRNKTIKIIAESTDWQKFI